MKNVGEITVYYYCVESLKIVGVVWLQHKNTRMTKFILVLYCNTKEKETAVMR